VSSYLYLIPSLNKGSNPFQVLAELANSLDELFFLDLVPASILVDLSLAYLLRLNPNLLSLFSFTFATNALGLNFTVQVQYLQELNLLDKLVAKNAESLVIWVAVEALLLRFSKEAEGVIC